MQKTNFRGHKNYSLQFIVDQYQINQYRGFFVKSLCPYVLVTMPFTRVTMPISKFKCSNFGADVEFQNYGGSLAWAWVNHTFESPNYTDSGQPHSTLDCDLKCTCGAPGSPHLPQTRFQKNKQPPNHGAKQNKPFFTIVYQ